LTERVLILDGPVEFEGDTSLPKWEATYGWPASVRKTYTLEAHVEALLPQFKLIRGPLPNERGRQSLVFERVEPNIPIRTLTADDVTAIRKSGTAIKSNAARDADSVIRVGNIRYKFDLGVQNDAVFLVLNSLPEWFAPTLELLMQDGKRIGDVAQWIKGKPNRTTKEIAAHWLRMNDMLACVGLVEIHLKLGDYLWSNGHYVDIDVDMVNHVEGIRYAVDYLEKWKRAGPRTAFGAKLANFIADNLGDEWVFQEALRRLK